MDLFLISKTPQTVPMWRVASEYGISVPAAFLARKRLGLTQEQFADPALVLSAMQDLGMRQSKLFKALSEPGATVRHARNLETSKWLVVATDVAGNHHPVHHPHRQLDLLSILPETNI